MNLRIALGAAGIALGAFGVFRLLTEVKPADLLMLAIWLAAAVILHDGVVSPIVAGLGWGMAKVVPARARRWVEAAFVTAVGVTVIALPMIHKENSQPVSKAILQQNFGAHLALVLGLIAGVSLLGYLLGLLRTRSAAKPLPSADHTSSTE